MSVPICNYCQGQGKVETGRYENCHACHGDGRNANDQRLTCPSCSGFKYSQTKETQTCSACGGTGIDYEAQRADQEARRKASDAAKQAQTRQKNGGSTSRPSAPAATERTFHFPAALVTFGVVFVSIWQGNPENAGKGAVVAAPVAFLMGRYLKEIVGLAALAFIGWVALQSSSKKDTSTTHQEITAAPAAIATPSPEEVPPAPAIEQEPWISGSPHPTIANTVASEIRDQWNPKPGYWWMDDRRQAVVWKPGLTNPADKNQFSGWVEGQWVSKVHFDYDKAMFEEKAIDESRSEPYPPARGTTGALFETGEFDYHFSKDDPNSLTLYFSKNLDLNTIAHVEFHKSDKWVVAVMTNGRRLEVCKKRLWQARPAWMTTRVVTIARTQNREQKEAKQFPVFALDGFKTVRKRYKIGIMGSDAKPTKHNGIEYPGGVVILGVFAGTPADESGLKIGDVLVQLNGRSLQTIQQLTEHVQKNQDSEISLRIIRGEHAIELLAMKPALGPAVVQ